MFDLPSIVTDYLPSSSSGNSADIHAATQYIYSRIDTYATVLDMLYILDITDPTREEQELSFVINQAIPDLQFGLFQYFHKTQFIPLYDINQQHLSIYLPLIHYMSRLNKIQLDGGCGLGESI